MVCQLKLLVPVPITEQVRTETRSDLARNWNHFQVLKLDPISEVPELGLIEL
jgi:hypothetical protein